MVLVFLGAGCVDPAVAPNRTPAKTAAAPSWKNVAAGIDRYECPASACGVNLILFRFAKDEFAWRFANRAEPSTVEAWAASLPQAVFIANGVYFDEKFQPTGTLVTGGAAVNGRSYDLGKSFLLELAPDVSIIDTTTGKLDLAEIKESAQSYPLLIKNGAPIASFKDKHAARRTVISLDKDANVYVGTVPEDNISFVDLAQLLAKTGVKWNNVLNLDGGTSTGFSLRAGNYEESMNSIVQVPNVIVAERK